MEMTLHFNDDDAHEVEKFKRAISADKAFGALWDIQQMIRNKEKHNDYSREVYEEVSKIQDEIYEIMADVDMSLWL